MKIITTILLVTFCVTLLSCRSANWHLKRAIELGARADSIATIILRDTIFTAETFDSSFIEISARGARITSIDTVVIHEFCKDPICKIKYLQRNICPQIDSVYKIMVEVQGKKYYLPVKITLKEGSYYFKAYALKIPYEKNITNVAIKPDTLTRFNLIAIAACLFFVGVLIGWIIGIVQRRA